MVVARGCDYVAGNTAAGEFGADGGSQAYAFQSGMDGEGYARKLGEIGAIVTELARFGDRQNQRYRFVFPNDRESVGRGALDHVFVARFGEDVAELRQYRRHFGDHSPGIAHWHGGGLLDPPARLDDGIDVREFSNVA